jgi:CRAL/TRIO domain/CRAL/TRIO, N-terminal domain
MATEKPVAPSVLHSASGDPEKSMIELEKAISGSKLEDRSFIPDPSAEKAETGTANGTSAIAATGTLPPAQTEPQVKYPIDDKANGSIQAPKLPHSAADGPLKTLFDAPLDSSKPKPRPDLTGDQEGKYQILLGNVEKWTEIPETSSRSAKATPLTDGERMFLTRECLLRYLRATTWNVAQAETRLKNTLIWRRDYGLQRITPDYISVENATGKQLIIGWDNDGRPCQYMRPSKQNTERTPRQIEHLVFMLERSIDLMPAGQETLTLLINFAETKSGQGATLSQGKQTMDILQNHYPERLGRALVTNVPFYIWGFFKLITPFIDPLTREKIKFNEDSGLHVPREQLLKESGGHVEFSYDHDQYWPALNKLCEAKRVSICQRWEKGGKRVGELEIYLKGGQEQSLSQVEAETSEKTNGA